MNASEAFGNIIKLFVSFILSAPICGFVGGMIVCNGCEGDILGRLLMGGIHAFLSTIGFSRLYIGNSGDMASISLLPYMIPVTLFIFGVLMFIKYRKQNT